MSMSLLPPTTAVLQRFAWFGRFWMFVLIMSSWQRADDSAESETTQTSDRQSFTSNNQTEIQPAVIKLHKSSLRDREEKTNCSSEPSNWDSRDDETQHEQKSAESHNEVRTSRGGRRGWGGQGRLRSSKWILGTKINLHQTETVADSSFPINLFLAAENKEPPPRASLMFLIASHWANKCQPLYKQGDIFPLFVPLALRPPTINCK